MFEFGSTISTWDIGFVRDVSAPHGPVVDSLIDRGFVVHAISRDGYVLADRVHTDRRLFRRLHVADPGQVVAVGGVGNRNGERGAGTCPTLVLQSAGLAWLLPARRPARPAYDGSNQASSGVQG